MYTTPPECEAPVTLTHCEAHLRAPDCHAQLYSYNIALGPSASFNLRRSICIYRHTYLLTYIIKCVFLLARSEHVEYIRVARG